MESRNAACKNEETLPTALPEVNPFLDKPQGLTSEQRERMKLNREAAIARKISSQKSSRVSAPREEDIGWRSVQKRPAGGHLTIPGRKQKVEGSISDLPVEPYYAARETLVPTPSSTEEVPKDKLRPSPEQMKVLKAVSMRSSVFLTGSAGTGKSFVLQFAIRQMRSMYGADAVFVTASTGLAACSIGGTTVHSFAGIGLGKEDKDTLVDKVMSRRETKSRWQRASALVIDEISMVDADLFEKLDYIGRQVRKKDRPFGGIQLLVTGDFYQLPPVSQGSQIKKFAFEAACWASSFQLQVELTQVFRQSDSEFVSMLNEIRRGQCSSSTGGRLQRCRGGVDSAADGVVMTRLYPHKVDVSRENEQKLKQLHETEMIYGALDIGTNEFAKKQLDNTRAEKVLPLRKGAQVMLIKNIDPAVGLANGARGVVVGFCDPNDPGAAQFRHHLPEINPSGMWPVVRFAADHSERIIGPDSWAIEDGGREIAKRTQVPLALAWALSVHKCQGMTLDRVETDLTKAFDYGMVYVALSRVRSLEGLNLLGFDPSKIKVHPKVARFYEVLTSAAATLDESSLAA